MLDDAQVRDILKMDNVAYQQMSDDGKTEFAKALKAQKPGTIEQFASFYDEKFLYYAANYSQNTAEGKRIIDKLYHRDALDGDDYENMTEKEMVAKRLAGKGALDKDSFLKEFSKAVFLTRLENTVGIADTNQLLVKYKSLLEGVEAYFSLSNTYAADKAIAGKSYATIEDCVKAINSAIGGGTKSPSGTGGGKSGNGAILNTNLDMSEQNTSDSNAEIFEDLGNVPWAKEAILALYKKGILSGDGNGRFRPEDTIKREEFVKLLTLTFECEVSGGELPFDDVKKEQWYYPYILSGYTKKLINGSGNNRFGIGENITREDMAVLIWRYMKNSGAEMKSEGILKFEDKALISDYALDAIYALTDKGIIKGMSDGTMKPKNSCRRAEAALVIYNALKYRDSL